MTKNSGLLFFGLCVVLGVYISKLFIALAFGFCILSLDLTAVECVHDCVNEIICGEKMFICA